MKISLAFLHNIWSCWIGYINKKRGRIDLALCFIVINLVNLLIINFFCQSFRFPALTADVPCVDNKVHGRD